MKTLLCLLAAMLVCNFTSAQIVRQWIPNAPSVLQTTDFSSPARPPVVADPWRLIEGLPQQVDASWVAIAGTVVQVHTKEGIRVTGIIEGVRQPDDFFLVNLPYTLAENDSFPPNGWVYLFKPAGLYTYSTAVGSTRTIRKYDYFQPCAPPEQITKEKFNQYQIAADQGDPVAAYRVATFYQQGLGVGQDYKKALHYYQLSAKGGNSAAAKICSAAALARGETQTQSLSVATEDDPTATGTGFFITDDGYLISNNHVVKGAAKVHLLTGAGLIDATVVKVDAANDLALLKAVGVFKPLPIAASRTAHLGGTVATVGFPDTGLQGFSPKLAKGEIGSLAGIQDDPRYFQISVPVQPGNSGGALVDARGNVVGIVAAKLNAQAALDATGSLPENVNYAVKSSLLLSFLESVPEVDAKLKELNTKDEPFEDVVKSAQAAAVLVLVY